LGQKENVAIFPVLSMLSNFRVEAWHERAAVYGTYCSRWKTNFTLRFEVDLNTEDIITETVACYIFHVHVWVIVMRIHR